MAVVRAATERPHRIDQAAILGREKGAGSVGPKGGALPALSRDLALEELPLRLRDGRLAAGPLEMAAAGRRGTDPAGESFLDRREDGQGFGSHQAIIARVSSVI